MAKNYITDVTIVLQHKTIDVDKCFSFEAYCEKTGCTRPTIYNHVSDGKLPIIFISDRVFIYLDTPAEDLPQQMPQQGTEQEPKNTADDEEVATLISNSSNQNI